MIFRSQGKSSFRLRFDCSLALADDSILTQCKVEAGRLTTANAMTSEVAGSGAKSGGGPLTKGSVEALQTIQHPTYATDPQGRDVWFE